MPTLFPLPVLQIPHYPVTYVLRLFIFSVKHLAKPDYQKEKNGVPVTVYRYGK